MVQDKPQTQPTPIQTHKYNGFTEGPGFVSTYFWKIPRSQEKCTRNLELGEES